jgi:hypothetical protein
MARQSSHRTRQTQPCTGGRRVRKQLEAVQALRFNRLADRLQPDDLLVYRPGRQSGPDTAQDVGAAARPIVAPAALAWAKTASTCAGRARSQATVTPPSPPSAAALSG